MRKNHIFPSVLQLFATGCIICTLTLLMTLSQQIPSRPFYPLCLPLWGPLVYWINRILLRRSRTIRFLVLFNGALWAGFFLLCLLISDKSSFSGAIFMGVFCLLVTVYASALATSAPALSGLILSLDGNITVLLIFVGFASITGVSLNWAIPNLLGCVASVFGVVSCRTRRIPGLRESGILAAILTVVSALMWIMLRYLAEPAGAGILGLWTLLKQLGRHVLSLAYRLLSWLVSLLPSGKEELPPFESVEITSAPQLQEPEANPLLGLILLVLAAALMLGLILWILRKLGKLQIGSVSTELTAESVRGDRPSFFHSLHRMISALLHSIRVQLYLLRNHSCPKGLYYLLIRRCRLSPWHKLENETPREFLSRLQDIAATDDALNSALVSLIPAVEQALFAPSSVPVVFPQADLICRRIGRAVRRQALSAFWHRLHFRKPAKS